MSSSFDRVFQLNFACHLTQFTLNMYKDIIEQMFLFFK
jgi:hypothetical protein